MYDCTVTPDLSYLYLHVYLMTISPHTYTRAASAQTLDVLFCLSPTLCDRLLGLPGLSLRETILPRSSLFNIPVFSLRSLAFSPCGAPSSEGCSSTWKQSMTDLQQYLANNTSDLASRPFRSRLLVRLKRQKGSCLYSTKFCLEKVKYSPDRTHLCQL